MTYTSAFRSIENARKAVFREIKYIREKLDQKSIDFLFFKKHKYTLEELLDSPHHKKIDSITNKLGSDIQNWHDRGTLLDDERDFYYRVRDEIDEELHNVNLEILQRKPEFLDRIEIALNEFVKLVMKNLPIFQAFSFTGLIKGILDAVKKLPGSKD
jgi:hypothetical protein